MRNRIFNEDEVQNFTEGFDAFSGRSYRYSKNGDNGEFGEGFEETEELFQTMGLQMEFSDQLKKNNENRKAREIKYIDIDPIQNEKITRELSEKYGSDSQQVRKWTEQIDKIERYKEEQRLAIKKQKQQSVIIGAVSGFIMLVIIAIIILIANSTTYYVNNGDYNYIYKKTLFGKPEAYIQNSVTEMKKEGHCIYYINSKDNKLCSYDLKDNTEAIITDFVVKTFIIYEKYIFYIDENETLYAATLQNNNSVVISTENCSDLQVYGKNITYKSNDVLCVVDHQILKYIQ